MTKLVALITDVLAASGGSIIGRIRLQKVFFLLERLGLNADIKFQYYHYGPYADQISTALDRAELVEGSVKEERQYTSFGAPYSVYTLSNPKTPPARVGELPFA